MSFILDSLKKSSEDLENAGPTNLLELVARGHQEKKTVSLRPWLWIFLLIMVALGTFSLAWWLLRGETSGKLDLHQRIAPPVETKALAAPPAKDSSPTSDTQEAVPWSHATVIGVLGPCLLELDQDGTHQKVKLAHIQCMGDKTLAGKSARAILIRLVFTRSILFNPISFDNQGMALVEIQTSKEGSINSRLVAEGLAKASGPQWQKEEQSAKQGQRGMWRNPKQWTTVPGTTDH